MSETATLVVTAVPNQDEMPSVQECLQGELPLLVGVGGTSIPASTVRSFVEPMAEAGMPPYHTMSGLRIPPS